MRPSMTYSALELLNSEIYNLFFTLYNLKDRRDTRPCEEGHVLMHGIFRIKSCLLYALVTLFVSQVRAVASCQHM